MRRTLLSAVYLVLAIGLCMRPGASDQLMADSTKPAQPNPALKFKVGDTAPDFTLRDQNGKEVSLHDYRGKKTVVLAFYVFAFTGG